MNDAPKEPAIAIGKLDAARRQLETAIRLWFAGGDPVSVHTLAYAAYEIIHAVSKKRNPSRSPLLFDSSVIKEEKRHIWASHLKEHGNFFKHGNNDPDGLINFRPGITDFFLLFSVVGLQYAGERLGGTETAIYSWFNLHRPDILSAEGQKLITDNVPVEVLNDLRSIPKKEFLEIATEAWNKANR